MTKTKTTLKCRIIEYDVFEKSETSIGLVWPAGEARPGWKKWPVGSSDVVTTYSLFSFVHMNSI